MGELDLPTRVMRDSNELWQMGEPRMALKLLDQSIAETIRQKKDQWVQVLCRHAALISECIGDLPGAKEYNEQALAHGPDNPMALYGLAKVLNEQGEPELAKQYAAKCKEAVVRSGSEIHQAVLDLIAKRWPEL
ncbi:MAG TPA: tetratricopeptide repeat protein [Candidatus Acidoferrales bacterium]|nr:tetratricopeptide repeat protein [Candidatus Acidoferrales bacterium]